jgi:hypothetical protein
VVQVVNKNVLPFFGASDLNMWNETKYVLRMSGMKLYVHCKPGEANTSLKIKLQPAKRAWGQRICKD